MADLQGQVGEMRFTLNITRAATGETEQVEMVGFLNEEQLKMLQASQPETKE
jgi:hypothetical protein